jgi:phospholipase/carboxylesterase
MASLIFEERPAVGQATGLLVLHHGRGTSELDLLPLADVLDPEQRLHVAAPRGPFQFPGAPGYHWYAVPRVGHPDPDTFHSSYRALAAFHDELWERTGLGPEQTVVGGFSMGTVMSYALGLGGERPAPRGILGFSGFVPTVEGWEPSLSDRQDTRAFISHGRRDPVIEVGFGRRARELLEGGGLEVEYHESDAAHQIDPVSLRAAVRWLSGGFAPADAS